MPRTPGNQNLNPDPDQPLTRNINIRVSPTELQAIDAYAQQLDYTRSDVFRGFIHNLPSAPRIKDGLKVTIGKTPMILTKKEAKQLLVDLTQELVK